MPKDVPEQQSREMNIPTDEPKNRTLESVQLDDETNSDDEWDELVEATNSEACKPEFSVSLMQDEGFIDKLKSRLATSSTQVSTEKMCKCVFLIQQLIA